MNAWTDRSWHLCCDNAPVMFAAIIKADKTQMDYSRDYYEYHLSNYSALQAPQL